MYHTTGKSDTGYFTEVTK